MKQEQISRLEDPNYSKFTLTTLKKLASAFDVGLMVRFVPISDLAKWELELTSESLEAVSFDDDVYFEDKPDSTQSVLTSLPRATAAGFFSGGFSIALSTMLLARRLISSFSSLLVRLCIHRVCHNYECLSTAKG